MLRIIDDDDCSGIKYIVEEISNSVISREGVSIMLEEKSYVFNIADDVDSNTETTVEETSNIISDDNDSTMVEEISDNVRNADDDSAILSRVEEIANDDVLPRIIDDVSVRAMVEESSVYEGNNNCIHY